MELWGFKRTWSYGASREHGAMGLQENMEMGLQENTELGGFRKTWS